MQGCRDTARPVLGTLVWSTEISRHRSAASGTRRRRSAAHPIWRAQQLLSAYGPVLQPAGQGEEGPLCPLPAGLCYFNQRNVQNEHIV